MKACTLANIAGWLLVTPLVVTAIAHGRFCYHYWGQLFGNGYIDPVGFILSYLAPIAGFGVAVLVYLRRRGEATTLSVALATSLALSFTFGLIAFGIWFFHTIQGAYLSDLVWWLKPFKLLGV